MLTVKHAAPVCVLQRHFPVDMNMCYCLHLHKCLEVAVAGGKKNYVRGSTAQECTVENAECS
jgi:hypothetical protein